MDCCDFELVKKIMASEEAISNGDGKIIVKAVPDGDGTGKMDKREFFIRSAIYAFQKSTPVKFSIEGPGEIVATDNGDETDFDDFHKPQRRTFNGWAQVIVRAKKGAVGKVSVKAESTGLVASVAEMTFVK